VPWQILNNDEDVGIEDCAENNGGCSEFATCTTTSDGVHCTCNNGFAGDGVNCTGKACQLTFYRILKHNMT